MWSLDKSLFILLNLIQRKITALYFIVEDWSKLPGVKEQSVTLIDHSKLGDQVSGIQQVFTTKSVCCRPFNTAGLHLEPHVNLPDSLLPNQLQPNLSDKINTEFSGVTPAASYKLNTFYRSATTVECQPHTLWSWSLWLQEFNIPFHSHLSMSTFVPWHQISHKLSHITDNSIYCF